MAFAEGGKKGEYIPTCHGCGRKCPGGWRKCKHITEDHRSKVAALDKGGHFYSGNNNNNNNRDTRTKKGTVNVAAGSGRDDDDGDKSESDTNKSDVSSGSGLTHDMTLGELLRLTGVVNTTIGMDKTSGEIYEEEGSWDGDVLSNIGVGFCQVQGEKPVINDQWMVQGRRGTNPFKGGTKVSSSLKKSDATSAERHEMKPAWIVESCLRKGERQSCGGRRVRIKECDKISKIKTASNKAFTTKRKIEAAVAKVIKKVIPKSKLLKDKISSPGGRREQKGG